MCILVRGCQRAVAQVPFEFCLHRDCIDRCQKGVLEEEVAKPPQRLCAACARAWRIPGLTNRAAAAPKPTTAWLILTDSSSQLPPVRICVLPAALRSTGGRAMMAGAAKGTRGIPHPSVRIRHKLNMRGLVQAKNSLTTGQHKQCSRIVAQSRPWKAFTQASSAPTDTRTILYMTASWGVQKKQNVWYQESSRP